MFSFKNALVEVTAASVNLFEALNHCTQRPCIFSWPMVISNSVNEFFVAV